jgi:hypothetical protein
MPLPAAPEIRFFHAGSSRRLAPGDRFWRTPLPMSRREEEQDSGNTRLGTYL